MITSKDAEIVYVDDYTASKIPDCSYRIKKGPMEFEFLVEERDGKEV